MLHKCANPACSTQFRYLRQGKLFQVETEYFPGTSQRNERAVRKSKPSRHVEHYWLCDECAPYITLTFDGEGGMMTVPLPEAGGKKTVTVIPPENAKTREERPLIRAYGQS